MAEALFSKDGLIPLLVLSVFTFTFGLIAIRYILIRLPANYFDERHPRVWLQTYPPVVRIAGLVLKNLLGVVLIVAGIIMLAAPGPGIVSLLIGVSLMDLPGKRGLERKLISLPAVLATINRMRLKAGKPPLTIKE